jgi:hypothetical protein
MAVLRHVVLFRFKADTSPAKLAEIEAAFVGLKAKIDVIQTLEWGTNCSPEGKAQGFTHCFFLTFASTADRDAYLPHPDHVAFSTLVRPHVDQVLVVDYAPAG